MPHADMPSAAPSVTYGIRRHDVTGELLVFLQVEGAGLLDGQPLAVGAFLSPVEAAKVGGAIYALALELAAVGR